MKRQGGFSSKKVFSAILAITILALCAIYIVRNFQWLQVGRELAGMNWLHFVIWVSAFHLLYCLIRSLRWALLLRQVGSTIPFLKIYLATTITIGLAMVTPFNAGEALKVELLKKHGLLDRSSGYGTFIIERAFDAAILFTLAAASLLAGTLGQGAEIMITACVLMLLALFFVYVFRNRIRAKGKVGRFLDDMRLVLDSPRSLFVVFILTITGWLMVAFVWRSCLASLSIDLGMLRSVELMSVVTAVNILSFIPGAVGVSEVGITKILMHFDIAEASAQAGAISLRFYSFLAIIVGVVHIGIEKVLFRSGR